MAGMDPLRDLLRHQDGVVSRAQMTEAGVAPSQIRRLLRRRELSPILAGVYVEHTGAPTWSQRAWAGVLHAWPAALCGESALRIEDGPGRRGFDELGPIHVAIDRKRNVCDVEGVVVHRLAHLDDKVLWNRTPPRLRIEEAAIDVAAAAGREIDVIAVIANAVGSRRTTVERLQGALRGRQRIAHRAFLAAVLDDLALGACSALEHGYLTRVERAHGLPAAGRQVRASVHGPIFRDVVYRSFGQVVELDGRMDHTHVLDRDRDLDRDLAAAVDRMNTVRVGWGQVFDRTCWTAVQVGRLLAAGGWSERIRRCPQCPD